MKQTKSWWEIKEASLYFFPNLLKKHNEYKQQRDKELREILGMFNTHQIYEIREKIKEMIKK